LVLLALMAIVAYVSATTVAEYQKLVPLPSNIKTQSGYTYLKSSTMTSLYGTPCPLEAECQPVTLKSLQIVTKTIGKFKVTGMSKAVDCLSRALTKVQSQKPDLYNALGSSGMLCCRAIRGSTTTYSNHAWGAAIDFNIGGVLDPRGDGKTQQGLLDLYPYMHNEGFYWAGGYSGSSEDAMHFEIADEVMRSWGGASGSSSSSSSSSSSTTGNPNSYVCATANVNIRSGACTSYSIITTAPTGAVLLVTGNGGSGCGYTWTKVSYNGKSGYVASTFVTSCASGQADPGTYSNDTLAEEPFDDFDYEAVAGSPAVALEFNLFVVLASIFMAIVVMF